MSPRSEYRDTCRDNVVRCAAKIGHASCGERRPVLGGASSDSGELRLLKWLLFANDDLVSLHTLSVWLVLTMQARRQLSRLGMALKFILI
jgi:hypothetical protein